MDPPGVINSPLLDDTPYRNFQENKKKQKTCVVALVVLVLLALLIVLVVELVGSSSKDKFGIIIHGGYSVSGCGDLNGDGINDFLIVNGKTMRVYVVFGGDDISKISDLSSMKFNGTTGFIITTRVHYLNATEFIARGAGDVNGDGLADILVGTPVGYIELQPLVRVPSQVFVVYGAAAYEPEVMLEELDGQSGYALNGTLNYPATGQSLDGVGDINGDGYGDIIIAEPIYLTNETYAAGRAFIIYGFPTENRTDLPIAVNLDSDYVNGTTGFICGGLNFDEVIQSVSGVGDINGDGISDIVIGSICTNCSHSARSFILYGKPQTDSFPSFLNLTNLDGTEGFIMITAVSYPRPTAGAGDLNNDSIHEFVLGDSVNFFVVFGRNGSVDPFPALWNPGDFDGANGVNMVADWPYIGTQIVNHAGDVNGDGIDDLLIGSSYSNNGAGKIYLIYGRDPFEDPTDVKNDSIDQAYFFPDHSKKYDLNTLDGTLGSMFNGISTNDNAGSSVAGVGDVNNDGRPDFLIGAIGGNHGSGECYLIWGRTSSFDRSLSLSDLK